MTYTLPEDAKPIGTEIIDPDTYCHSKAIRGHVFVDGEFYGYAIGGLTFGLSVPEDGVPFRVVPAAVAQTAAEELKKDIERKTELLEQMKQELAELEAQEKVSA